MWALVSGTRASAEPVTISGEMYSTWEGKWDIAEGKDRKMDK